MPKGAGIAIGVAIGVALGAAFDNLPIGIAIGIAIGGAFEAGSYNKREEKGKEEDKNNS